MYLAYVIRPNGCDYTIACGHLLLELKADTLDDAITELRARVTSDFTGETQLSNVTLLHVTQKIAMPVVDWYREHEQEKQWEQQHAQEQYDREQYEELRKRFG